MKIFSLKHSLFVSYNFQVDVEGTWQADVLFVSSPWIIYFLSRFFYWSEPPTSPVLLYIWSLKNIEGIYFVNQKHQSLSLIHWTTYWPGLAFVSVYKIHLRSQPWYPTFLCCVRRTITPSMLVLPSLILTLVSMSTSAFLIKYKKH